MFPIKHLALITLAGLLILAGLACTLSPEQSPVPEATPEAPPSPRVTTVRPEMIPTGQARSIDPPARVGLAGYEELPVEVQPAAPSYTFHLASLVNLDRLSWLNLAQQARLEANGFVVVPEGFDRFTQIYQRADQSDMPAFVTTDAILHAYHLLYDASLRLVEEEHLMESLSSLGSAMVEESQAQMENTEGLVQEAARRNLAFFSVAAGLLDSGFQPVEAVAQVVNEELMLIEGQEGVFLSPLFGNQVDYSQYRPRGHYSRSEAFERYFRAMTWFGRAGFRLRSPDDPTAARRETRQAMLMVIALQRAEVEGAPALQSWERIYQPTAFFVEAADDLTVYDYRAAAKAVYREMPQPADLAEEGALSDLIATLETLQKPKILGERATEREIEPEDGPPMQFRFMGQRSVPDSAIFQELVYSRVGLYQGNGEPFTLVRSPVGLIRGLPRGLDLAAALGSERALEILEAEGDAEYDGYQGQVALLQGEFSELPPEQWHATLYWSWLYSLQPLLDTRGEDYPPFMQSAAWTDKELNTWLGSWTELRHDTLLYAKQSTTVAATGIELEERPVCGYVEPQPFLYARLAALTRQMREGLERRSLLNEELGGKLMGMEDLLLTVKTVAEKELRGEALSQEEYLFIREIGDRLERMTTFSAEIEEAPALEGEAQVALVADVHSDPNSGQVLEQGLGEVYPIYVIVQVEGNQYLTLGGVFSYYEFKLPLSERLTDEAWRAMDPPPERPAWTDSFTVP